MSTLNLLRKVKERLSGEGRVSYAQCGEDLIISTLLELLKIATPVYLDVGAHHASYLSNTYLLYKAGGHGVCVEPDPTLCDAIRKARARDVCLNVGVGTDHRTSADFYVLNVKTLNTFSREEAELQLRDSRHCIEQVIQVPLLPLEAILSDHFSSCPNFVSLDTEGMDYEILKDFNFKKYRPEVFCIETLTHPDERKVTEVVELMFQNGYRLYADTYINSIFVDGGAWEKRGLKDPLRLHLQND